MKNSTYPHHPHPICLQLLIDVVSGNPSPGRTNSHQCVQYVGRPGANSSVLIMVKESPPPQHATTAPNSSLWYPACAHKLLGHRRR